MKKIKNCINFFITTLLVVTIVLTVMSGFTRFVLTDKQVYVTLLNKTNTYSLVQDALYQKMSALLGNDISDDLKQSIITEDDVRKESDIVLDCMISNIKTGQSNIPDIDKSVYVQRTADALKSLTGYESKINIDKKASSNDMNYNSVQLTLMNSTVNENLNAGTLEIKDVKQKSSKDVLPFENNGENIITQNMDTREQLEAKGRAYLQEKGISEAEARKKLAEKGLSEGDVWDYLKRNGYLDDESNSNDNTQNSQNSENIENGQGSLNQSENDVDTSNEVDNTNESNTSEAENTQNIDNNADASNEDKKDTSKVSKKKIQDMVIPVILDKNKTFDEKMQEISSKLMAEAENIIDIELAKLNFSELIATKEFSLLVGLTSILYKIFYLCLALLFVLSLIIIANNTTTSKKSFRCIGSAAVLSGAVLSVGFGSVLYFKLYKIVQNHFNKDYFEPMFLNTSHYFCEILIVISICVFVSGLIIKLFGIKFGNNEEVNYNEVS